MCSSDLFGPARSRAGHMVQRKADCVRAAGLCLRERLQRSDVGPLARGKNQRKHRIVVRREAVLCRVDAQFPLTAGCSIPDLWHFSRGLVESCGANSLDFGPFTANSG